MIRRRSFASGFTLTEVLVVITIIAVLTAVSTVAIGKMRARAASAVSVSNLRQFGAAMHGFAGENSARFPNIGNWTTPEDAPAGFRGAVSWDGYLFPYLGLDDVRPGEAPKDMENLFVHRNDKRTNTHDRFSRRSYAMLRAVNGRNGWDGTKFNPVAKALNPSRTGLLSERPWGGGMAGTPSFADISNALQFTQDSDGRELNPGGKFNVLFVDGHVQSMTPEETAGTGSLANPLGIWTFDEND